MLGFWVGLERAIHPPRSEVSVEPHLGGLPAAAGVVGTELGHVGVVWNVQRGPWSPPWPRTVYANLNVTGAGGLSLRVALPLDDPATAPPPSAAALTAFCLDVTAGGGATTSVNVTEALASGELVLDESRRFLRGAWEAAKGGRRPGASSGEGSGWAGGPMPRGVSPEAVSSLQLWLYAPPSGTACGSGIGVLKRP